MSNSDDFKPGDVVQLRTGVGPPMVIETVGDLYGEPKVWVAWFVGTKLEKANFSPSALKKVK
jgi:uncharacterized protein YodC (DUF2158 family)